METKKEILPYPICSVVAVFKMLVRILNTLRSRIWDRAVFLFSDYLNLRFNNMECARRLQLSGKLNSKGLTFKFLVFIPLVHQISTFLYHSFLTIQQEILFQRLSVFNSKLVISVEKRRGFSKRLCELTREKFSMR